MIVNVFYYTYDMQFLLSIVKWVITMSTTIHRRTNVSLSLLVDRTIMTLKLGDDHCRQTINGSDNGAESEAESIMIPYISQRKEKKISKDINNKNIFMSHVSKSTVSKNGKLKKHDRVWDRLHSCCFCSKLKTNISKHLRRHSEQTAVAQLLAMEATMNLKNKQEKEDAQLYVKIQMELLRNKGDNEHNRKVIASGGELIVARRENGKAFDQTEYGPCDRCLLWLKLSDISKHQKYRCIALKTSNAMTVSTKKGIAMLKAKLLRGDGTKVKISPLLQEVIGVIRDPGIQKAILDNRIICELGEEWLAKSSRNKLKRKAYAAERMRLTARLLLKCQELDAECRSIDTLLTMRNFDLLIKGALMLAGQVAGDTDMLRPATLLKIGNDVEKMIAIKQVAAIECDDDEKRSEATDLLHLMRNRWSERLAGTARAQVEERRFKVQANLPSPEDLKKLSSFIHAEIQKCGLVRPNLKRAMVLAQARLALFNKRRPGELEGLQ